MKIEDILASKGKKTTKKGYTLVKSSFNCEAKEKSGKTSKTKLDVNDKDFWRKTGIKFKGFGAK